MRGYDLTPFRRSTVGFDRLFDYLESATRAEPDNYPPFDIEKLGDDTYRITVAVAGFKRDEIGLGRNAVHRTHTFKNAPPRLAA